MLTILLRHSWFSLHAFRVASPQCFFQSAFLLFLHTSFVCCLLNRCSICSSTQLHKGKPLFIIIISLFSSNLSFPFIMTARRGCIFSHVNIAFVVLGWLRLDLLVFHRWRGGFEIRVFFFIWFSDSCRT